MSGNFIFTLSATRHDSSSAYFQAKGAVDNESNLAHIFEATSDAFLRALAALPSLPPPPEPPDAQPE